jgi:hypothetical protein
MNISSINEINRLKDTISKVDQEISRRRTAIKRNMVRNAGIATRDLQAIELQNNQRKAYMHVNRGQIEAIYNANAQYNTMKSSFITPDGPKDRGNRRQDRQDRQDQERKRRNEPAHHQAKIHAARSRPNFTPPPKSIKKFSPPPKPISISPPTQLIISKPVSPTLPITKVTDAIRQQAHIAAKQKSLIIKKQMDARRDAELVKQGKVALVAKRRQSDMQKEQKERAYKLSVSRQAKINDIKTRALNSTKVAQEQAQKKSTSMIRSLRSKPSIKPTPAPQQSQQINRTPPRGPLQPLPSQPSTYAAKSALEEYNAKKAAYARKAAKKAAYAKKLRNPFSRSRSGSRGIFPTSAKSAFIDQRRAVAINAQVRTKEAPVTQAAMDHFTEDIRQAPVAPPYTRSKEFNEANKYFSQELLQAERALRELNNSPMAQVLGRDRQRFYFEKARSLLNQVRDMIQNQLTRWDQGALNAGVAISTDNRSQSTRKMSIDEFKSYIERKVDIMVEPLMQEVQEEFNRAMIEKQAQSAPARPIRDRNIDIQPSRQLQLSGLDNHRRSGRPVLSEQQGTQGLAGLFPALRSSMQGALKR